jgi:hypothetical protein
MTTPQPTAALKDGGFDNTSYSISEETGFFARNNDGTADRFTEFSSSFIEFKESPYSPLERQALKRRVDAIPTVPDKAITDGLVAWYRFDGDTARDYTAFLDDDRFADTTAFDGTVNGASFKPNGGVRDVVSGANPSGAYDHDGVDDFIDIGNIPPIENESAIAWGGWIDNITNFNKLNREMIGNFQSSSFDDAISILRTDTKVRAAVFNSNNSVQATEPLPTDGNPHHYFATFDSGDIKLYIDGSQVSSASSNVSQTPTISLTLMTRLFKSRFVEGVVDDIRFYNRALSGTEINQIYQNTDPQ